MVTTNRFGQRLAKNGGAFSGTKTFYTCFMFGLLISLIVFIDTALSKQTNTGLDWFQISVFVSSLSIIISLPLLMTYVATAVTVTYTKSSEFPFLLLTNLPPREIVYGYLYATIFRCRAIIAFVGSLSIAFSITFGYGGFSGTVYPATLGFGLAESLLKHMMMGMAISLFIGSICLLGTSMGILLGLWWRQTAVANVTATISLILITFWWLDKVDTLLYASGLNRLIAAKYTNDLIHPIIFTLLPLLLSWAFLRISCRWARKARFKP